MFFLVLPVRPCMMYAVFEIEAVDVLKTNGRRCGMEIVCRHIEVKYGLLDARVQMQARRCVQIADSAAFCHIIHAVLIPEAGDRGENEPLFSIKRLLVISGKVRSPISVYVARCEGADARCRVIIHGVGYGIVRHAPSSRQEEVPARLVIAKRSAEVYAVSDTAFQVRIALVDVQRVRTVSIVKQAKEVGVGGCHFIVEITILKAP